MLVPGNGESDDELRAACRGWETAHVLHGDLVTIDRVEFFGIGAGIPITPFGSWSFDLSEQERRACWRLAPRMSFSSATHHHTDTWTRAGGAHLGSQAVLETIERVSPRLVVCGHIHGCWGRRSTVGSTPILNAGPDGHVLEV